MKVTLVDHHYKDELEIILKLYATFMLHNSTSIRASLKKHLQMVQIVCSKIERITLPKKLVV